MGSSRQSNASLTSLGTNSSGISQRYSDREDGTYTEEIRHRNGPEVGFFKPEDKIRRRREFKGRHIMMMGLGITICYLLLSDLGASIGTGLFYQSGKALYFAGPIPTLVAYSLMGTVVYAVLVR